MRIKFSKQSSVTLSGLSFQKVSKAIIIKRQVSGEAFLQNTFVCFPKDEAERGFLAVYCAPAVHPGLPLWKFPLKRGAHRRKEIQDISAMLQVLVICFLKLPEKGHEGTL